MPMRITLHQLQLFDAAARMPSFKAAAETLNLSPPALSIQLKILEESLGVSLFEQIGKKKYLTSPGMELQQVCHRIFDELNHLDMRFTQLRGGMAGKLSIAIVTSAKYFTPHLFGAFQRVYPNVEFNMIVANRTRILERLENNADDLVIMAHVPDAFDIKAIDFLDNPLIVIASPDHPLVNVKNIAFEQLVEQPFLIRESGSGTRMAVEQYFSTHNAAMKVAMELGSSEAIKQGVLARLGISILSRHCVWLELKTGFLKQLDVQGFPDVRSWYVVYRQGKQLSPVAEAFIKYIVANGQIMLDEVEQLYR